MTGRAREVVTLVTTFAASFLVVSIGFGDWRFGLGFVLLILAHELGHI